MTPITKALQALSSDLSFTPVPLLDDLIRSGKADFPYELDFENAVHTPVLVMHSSGSTGNLLCAPFIVIAHKQIGLPKPIVMTHGTLATIDDSQNLRDIPGRKRHDFTL